MKLAQIAVSLLDHMGSDLTVANAARVSFGKRSEEFTPRDKGLIYYLAEHGHWSPFAHPQLSFHIKAPIFVARQLAKHQVGLAWNEVSRRYVDDAPEIYCPKWRSRAHDKKQGSGPDLEEWKADWANEIQAEIVPQIIAAYGSLLANGVSPEQARGILPLATLTEWHWTGSLYAFARVCQLRLKPDVQAETREVAEGIARHARGLFPVSWKALLGSVGDHAEAGQPQGRGIPLGGHPGLAGQVGADHRVDEVPPGLRAINGADLFKLTDDVGHVVRVAPGPGREFAAGETHIVSVDPDPVHQDGP